MASTTSFFNGPLYRKDLGRFWPLALLWGLGWLLLPLEQVQYYAQMLSSWAYGPLEAQLRLTRRLLEMPNFLPIGMAAAMICAAAVAMGVFSYLYSSRSACMMHALPIRREGLFFSHYLAGLTLLLLPLVLVALVCCGVCLALVPGSYWGAVFNAIASWLLPMLGGCVFFFSFACFCAMFTGHILALPVFYGVLNVLVYMVHSLLCELMREFFYGFSYFDSALVTALTPLYALSSACAWTGPGQRLAQVTLEDGSVIRLDLYHLSDPLTIALYVLVGLALALAALAVYRRRHIESAGDVVSVPLVRPMFKFGVALCSGLFLGVMLCAFLGLYELSSGFLVGSVLFWTAVGYWAAEMLLQKSFRVFKAWKGCVAAVALMALLCASFAFDWFGYETRTPDLDQIQQISFSSSAGYPNDDGQLELLTLEDPQYFPRVLALHRAVVAGKERAEHYGSSAALQERSQDLVSICITYHLKNGGLLSREYWSVPIYADEAQQQGSLTALLGELVLDPALVEQAYGFQSCEEGQLVTAYLTDVYQPASDSYQEASFPNASPAELMELWQAVRADFDQGTIGARYLFSDREREENCYRADLVFAWEVQQDDPDSAEGSRSWTRELRITLTPHASRTLAWLEQMQALEPGQELITLSQALALLPDLD